MGEGTERMRVGRDEVAVVVASADTGGALMAMEVRMPAGGGPPGLHRHDPEEVYRVERGRLTVLVEDEGGDVRTVEAGPGEAVHIPGGRMHTVRNLSDQEATAFVVFTPGAPMEGFLRAAAALAAAGPPEWEAVSTLAERHGIEMEAPLTASSARPPG